MFGVDTTEHHILGRITDLSTLLTVDIPPESQYKTYRFQFNVSADLSTTVCGFAQFDVFPSPAPAKCCYLALEKPKDYLNLAE
jgi:hypothetical protein